jgi:hypothetical protein
VAIDTPVRTYLDMVKIDPEAIGHWQPDSGGWPLLAQWENATKARAVRSKAFSVGQTLSPSEIIALLPSLAPASTTLDIASAPYRAPPSPADATAAIQSALDDASRMAAPGRPVDVLVPAGTYDHSAVLEVASDVRLRGEGGILRATDPAKSAIHLVGSRSGALFLVLTVQASRRASTAESSGIWVGPAKGSLAPVRDAVVVGNEIAGPSGAHVLGIAEDGGLWAFNYAHDGFADAFHHTAGSHDCQVVANRASGPGDRGDDLYAFVGYHRDGDPVHHCSCVANWGRNGKARGLSAVGAGFIAFEHNDISRTRWAGVYIARESSYDTYGSFSIAVIDNRITFANEDGTHDGVLAFADAPTDTSPSRTFGEVANRIRDLTIRDNVLADTGAGRGGGYAIEVRSSCTGGAVAGNTVKRARAPGIVVAGAGYTVSSNTLVVDGAEH